MSCLFLFSTSLFSSLFFFLFFFQYLFVYFSLCSFVNVFLAQAYLHRTRLIPFLPIPHFQLYHFVSLF